MGKDVIATIAYDGMTTAMTMLSSPDAIWDDVICVVFFSFLKERNPMLFFFLYRMGHFFAKRWTREETELGIKLHPEMGKKIIDLDEFVALDDEMRG